MKKGWEVKTIRLLMIFVLILSASVLLTACGDDNDEKGACVNPYNYSNTCGDYTKNECSEAGGTFYSGETCAGRGYGQ